MKKLVYYIQIVTWMSEMKNKEMLFSSQQIFGNLAYFVDGYAERSEFSNYMLKIKDCIQENDLNELCWSMNLWISQLIKKDIEQEKVHSRERKEWLEFQMGLLEEDYRFFRCDDFSIADETMYPDWFWEYYNMKMTESSKFC